jgi:hypothetical protein
MAKSAVTLADIVHLATEAHHTVTSRSRMARTLLLRGRILDRVHHPRYVKKRGKRRPPTVTDFASAARSWRTSPTTDTYGAAPVVELDQERGVEASGGRRPRQGVAPPRHSRCLSFSAREALRPVLYATRRRENMHA